MPRSRSFTAHQSKLTKSGLRELLIEYKIPIATWGKNDAKTVDALYQEVRAGETRLVVDPKTKKLVREVGIVKIDVRYKDEHGECQLVEDFQEFADGRKRSLQQECPVGEKMKPHENPLQTFKRALKEELGITQQIPGRATRAKIITKMSRSYPGLLSRYEEHRFIATLPKKYYNGDGYVEVDGDRKTYFSWKCLSQVR